MVKIKKFLFRLFRIIQGKKGIYGKIGKHNAFTKGVIVYEAAVLGNYNQVSPYTLIHNAKIGNYCSIGPMCCIGLGEHDLRALSTRTIIANGKGRMNIFDWNNPTIIGNDVWTGANVTVLQGVKIGHGAVIGANSVVTKDIPDYAVAVGVPAKIIKYRFGEDIINKLVQSKWYDYDLSEAQERTCKIVQELDL